MFGVRATEPAPLHRSLIEDDNALRVQSKEHPDGWGIGYYSSGGSPDPLSPLVVRSISPAFADEEFDAAARRVSACTVVAHVRLASCGPVCLANTHPFHYGRWLFAHNGTVREFERCRARLEAEIDGALRPSLAGDTDSERCFFMLLSRLKARRPLDEGRSPAQMAEALLDTVAAVRAHADVSGEPPSSLTFILTDGLSLIAYRDGRTLHYKLERLPGRTDGHPLEELSVASEVLGAEQTWAEVPQQGLVGVDAEMGLYLRAGGA
jgi:predicted glutamine amidotransferase